MMKAKTKRLTQILFLLTMSVCFLTFGSVALTRGAVHADVQSATLTISTSEKAEIRNEDPVGIRFTSTISLEDYNKLPENAQFGTLIIPTALLSSGSELTKDTARVLDVVTDEAKLIKTSTDVSYRSVLGGVKENGVVTDFAAANYNVPLSARGYVTYNDGTGEKTVYSTTTTERSVAQVASLALADGSTDDLLCDIVEVATPETLSFVEGEIIRFAPGESQIVTLNCADNLTAKFTATSGLTFTANANTVEVSAADAGEYTLTATLGNKQCTLTVIVEEDTGYYHAGYARATLNQDGTLSAEMPFGQDPTNFVATKTDYDINTYVRLDFKGENFPGMIIFGASNLVTDNGDFRGAGKILGYGLSISNNATMLSTYKCTAAGSGTAGYLTSNLVSGDVNYFNNNYFYRADKVPGADTDTPAGGSQKEFIALVGSKIDHVNRIILEYYLYEKNSDGTATLIETNTTNAGLIGCKSTAYDTMPVINTVGKIVVTGDYLVSGSAVTKITMHTPDTLENLQKNITTPLDKLYYQSGASAVLNEDGTLSAEIPFGATTTNFIATKNDYDLGTYVRLDFKGENFPGMIIFGASNLVTDNGNFRGTGKILGYGLSISNNATNYTTYKCTEVGKGNVNSFAAVNYFNNNYFYRVDKNVSPDTSVTTTAGGSQKEFIALVGSKVDNVNRIILEYYLYEKNADGTATLIETNTTNAGLIGYKDTEINTVGKIVVTSDYLVNSSTVTKITMHTPDTLENLQKGITLSSND